MEKKLRNHSSGKSADLVSGPVGKTLLAFSVPFVISTLLQTLYSTVDTIVVGQYLGKTGLSAVSNGSQLMQMIYMICIGFASAGQVLIAQAAGSEKHDTVQKAVNALCILETVLSLALGVMCMAGSRWFLSVLNTPEEAIEQASYYVIICGGGILFTGLYNVFSAILRGLGDSRHPLIFVIIATVVNLILDVLFVIVLDWNVAGAAWATIIGQLVSVLFSIVFLQRHAEDFKFTFSIRSMRLDSKVTKQLIKLGIPMSVHGAAVQSSFLFVSFMVNSLGLTASAAFGTMVKLRNIPGVLTQGFGMGATSMIGQNLGAGKTERVKQTVNWCLLLTTIVNAAFGILFAIAPAACFRIFTTDADVLAFAGICCFALIIELPGKCVMPACNALVNAQGFVKFSMTVAFLDAFAGRIFLCWFLGIFLDLGILGFFLGYSLATYVTAVPVFIYYVSGWWKRRDVLV